MSSLAPMTIEALIKSALLVFGFLTAAAYLVLLERRVAAWVQDRRGPNRVGIPLTRVRAFGLGQPLADGMKFIFKEEYVPSHVDRAMYVLAPIAVLVAALGVFAVIPVGSFLPITGADGPVELVVAPGIDVGMIYVFALGSLAVYGVILGGWASNNKYSFLGGLRSSAQLIAYELPLGLGILGVVLLTGSLRLDEIIARQAESGQWNVFVQPLGFVVFLVAAFAEAARLPFDLPEAEQELIGGYHTEYAGVKLLMYLVAEFLHMVTSAFLIVILFLGGWHVWGMPAGGDVGWLVALARVAILGLKVLAVILFFMLVRWTWPRFRFDQLMTLAWKVMLPLGTVNLVLVAVLAELIHQPGSDVLPALPGWMLAASWLAAVGAGAGVAMLMPGEPDNRPRLGDEQRP